MPTQHGISMKPPAKGFAAFTGLIGVSVASVVGVWVTDPALGPFFAAFAVAVLLMIAILLVVAGKLIVSVADLATKEGSWDRSAFRAGKTQVVPKSDIGKSRRH